MFPDSVSRDVSRVSQQMEMESVFTVDEPAPRQGVNNYWASLIGKNKYTFSNPKCAKGEEGS